MNTNNIYLGMDLATLEAFATTVKVGDEIVVATYDVSTLDATPTNWRFALGTVQTVNRHDIMVEVEGNRLPFTTKTHGVTSAQLYKTGWLLRGVRRMGESYQRAFPMTDALRELMGGTHPPATRAVVETIMHQVKWATLPDTVLKVVLDAVMPTLPDPSQRALQEYLILAVNEPVAVA